jgi:hypothetical protein
MLRVMSNWSGDLFPDALNLEFRDDLNPERGGAP